MIRTNRTRLLALVAAVAMLATLLFTGCGEDHSAEDADAPASPTVEDLKDVPAADVPKDYSKYNAYIDLMDDIYELSDKLDVYFAYVDYAPEFALMEGADYGAMEDGLDFYTPNTYHMVEALDYADEDPAYPEVDQAVKALGSSVEDSMDALSAIASYVCFGDYAEDDLAQAPQLHAELWQAVEVFDANYRTFLDAMSTLIEETKDEDLEKLLEDEELICYYSSHMISLSQEVLSEILAQVSMADSAEGEALQLPTIDMTALSPLFGEFNEDYTQLDAALSDPEQLEKVEAFSSEKPTAESALQLYTNKVNALYVDMGRLAQALMDGSDYADAVSAVMDSSDSLVDGYNTLLV